MDEFVWMDNEELSHARRRPDGILHKRGLTSVEAQGLELYTPRHESTSNPWFQDIGEHSYLLNPHGFSMPLGSSSASVHDTNPQLNFLFSEISTFDATDLLHNDLRPTHERSTCEAGGGLVDVEAAHALKNMELWSINSQITPTPSDEDLDQRNEPGFTSRSYKCAFCDEVNSSLDKHHQHVRLHGYTCHQCGQSFESHWSLNYHADVTAHEAYHCIDCNATFSRIDVLRRHKIQHATSPVKYSCSHCKKWRAPNGFARKDHLTQHLRNFHHIDGGDSSAGNHYSWSRGDPYNLNFHNYCIVEGCSFFQPDWTTYVKLEGGPLFESRGAFTSHMRKEHDYSSFPCTILGCKRVNGKGFFRKRDLIKHKKREHDGLVEDDFEIAKEMNGEGSSTFSLPFTSTDSGLGYA